MSTSKRSKYAAKAWGKEIQVDLEVPSGQLCLVRRPGIPGLIKAGVLDSLDSLTGLVQTEHVERVRSGGVPEVSQDAIRDLAGNKAKMMTALTLSDKVVEYVVIEPNVLRAVERNEDGTPKLRPAIDRQSGEPILNADGTQADEEIPLPDSKRPVDFDGVWVEDIDLMDKMFIFQFVVGGVSDLAQFRKEFGETLGGLEALTDVPGAA